MKYHEGDIVRIAVTFEGGETHEVRCQVREIDYTFDRYFLEPLDYDDYEEFEEYLDSDGCFPVWEEDILALDVNFVVTNYVIACVMSASSG